MKRNVIINSVIILCAIVAIVISTISNNISWFSFYIWMALVILSRIQIILMHYENKGSC